MSFKKYIMSRRITDTPNGDFVSDSQCVADFPDAKTWDELSNYLRQRNACSKATAAGKRVWRQYERTQAAVSSG
ncbi:YozE family protein [Hyphomonas sp.]|uniref:YozE family protein n=1 Tax=Hyphomonas sp. TaxID=87 RepID=UPI0030F8775C